MEYLIYKATQKVIDRIIIAELNAALQRPGASPVRCNSWLDLFLLRKEHVRGEDFKRTIRIEAELEVAVSPGGSRPPV